jgi:multisubunit Na+/H+ antiporter MnhB subunit
MNLTNKWMNDPTYLAQAAHLLGAYSVMITAGHFWGHVGCIIAAIVFTALTAVKEFWYDANYEIPKQTNFDNILDFSMYAVGTIIGLLIVLLT